MKLDGLKLKAAAKKLLRGQRKSPSGMGRTRLGILLEDPEDLKVVEALVGELKLREEEVQVLFCRRKGKAISSEEFFDIKDISWGGVIKKPLIHKFLCQEYEVLVCFTSSQNEVADMVATVVKADLKIGRQGISSPAYDISISVGEDQPELFALEVKKYVKILKQ